MFLRGWEVGGGKNTTEENMKGNEQKMLEARLVVLWKKIFRILPLQQLWIINKGKKSGLGVNIIWFLWGGQLKKLNTLDEAPSTCYLCFLNI